MAKHNISVQSDLFTLPEKNIEIYMRECLSLLKKEHDILKGKIELSIVLTNDVEIKQLNTTYRSKAKATDVLSFSQLKGELLQTPGLTQLGDIIISMETALKQSIEYETSYSEEIARLLVHGLLHLLGYDHEDVSKEEAEEMFLLQDQVLSKTDSSQISIIPEMIQELISTDY